MYLPGMITNGSLLMVPDMPCVWLGFKLMACKCGVVMLLARLGFYLAEWSGEQAETAKEAKGKNWFYQI